MNIALGFDHAAVESKAWLIPLLEGLGHTVQDMGCYSTDSCDYPDFAAAVARIVAAGDAQRGILICGTGLGMSIAANRFAGVRAALCTSVELARLSREHNDANVLCMGARTQQSEDMQAIVKTWLETDWEGGRHGRRLDKIESHPKE
jgi:ribose 5-phosphate isomerase B